MQTKLTSHSWSHCKEVFSQTFKAVAGGGAATHTHKLNLKMRKYPARGRVPQLSTKSAEEWELDLSAHQPRYELERLAADSAVS